MGKQKYLMIHCTATPEGREVSAQDIINWHTLPKPRGRGWRQVGYSDMIHLDGSLTNLVEYDYDGIIDSWEVTNGARGYNGIAKHVVYVGGLNKGWTKEPKDTRTEAQKEELEKYVFLEIYMYPDVKIIGHNDVSQKACPSFDVKQWCREIGIDEKNIGL